MGDVLFGPNGLPIDKDNPMPTSLTGSNVVNGGQVKSTLFNSVGIEAFLGVHVDGEAERSAIYNHARQMGFNGASWDRIRNNTQGTLLASAARTASISSPTQTNYNARGVQVVLKVTAASGTGGLTVIIQGIDPVSNGSFNAVVNPTAVTAVSTYVYELYPGASGTGGAIMQRTSGPLPRNWQVTVVHGDSSSYTYSLGYAYIL